MTKNEFIKEINRAIEIKPISWTDGQAVFNYIDSKYGVARDIQFLRKIDCFHDDSLIQQFINAAYDLIRNGNVHDYPGNNMIEE